MTDAHERTDNQADDELISDRQCQEEDPFVSVRPTDGLGEDDNEIHDDLISSFRRGNVDKEMGDTAFAYLQEIARTPLLTPQEEAELFQQFSAATHRMTQLLKKLPPSILAQVQFQPDRRRGAKPKFTNGLWWSPMEIGTILEQIETGLFASKKGQTQENQAKVQDAIETLWNQLTVAAEAMEAVREKIVAANLLLVASIAKHYHCYTASLSFLDLMQEGSIGLIKAVEKFDSQRGCRFSTFATWWVMQLIRRAFSEQSQVIRTPSYVGEVRRFIARAQAQLVKDLKREPSLKEIAQAVRMSESRVVEILRSAKGTISLSSPLGEDTDAMISDVLADESDVSPEAALLCLSEREVIDQVLNTLPPREALVVKLRYGLSDGTEYSLAQIGPKLGVSRERVRQIEVQALRKLRHPTRVKYLKELL